MMRILPTAFGDVHALGLRVFQDARGMLVKTFHAETFAALGLPADFKECYFTRSVRDTVRGMHFQIPPADHSKLVSIVSGRVLDVVLCLRKGDPNYGKYLTQELGLDGDAQAIYIPGGYAHGFLALTPEATVQYLTTTVHAPDCDRGIRWDSFGFAWPVDKPVVSERDRSLPALAEFASPFTVVRKP